MKRRETASLLLSEGSDLMFLEERGSTHEYKSKAMFTKETLEEKFRELGNPTVIAGCPTCKKVLSGHEDLEILGIWDILNDIGLPEGGCGLCEAALHDSCGARGDAETQSAIRALAQKLGCTLVDTPYSGDQSPLLRLWRPDPVHQPGSGKGYDGKVPGAVGPVLHFLLHGLPGPFCPGGKGWSREIFFTHPMKTAVSTASSPSALFMSAGMCPAP